MSSLRQGLAGTRDRPRLEGRCGLVETAYHSRQPFPYLTLLGLLIQRSSPDRACRLRAHSWALLCLQRNQEQTTRMTRIRNAKFELAPLRLMRGTVESRSPCTSISINACLLSKRELSGCPPSRPRHPGGKSARPSGPYCLVALSEPGPIETRTELAAGRSIRQAPVTSSRLDPVQ